MLLLNLGPQLTNASLLQLGRRMSPRSRRLTLKVARRVMRSLVGLPEDLLLRRSLGQQMSQGSFSSSSSGRVRRKLTWLLPRRPMSRFLKLWSSSTRTGWTGTTTTRGRTSRGWSSFSWICDSFRCDISISYKINVIKILSRRLLWGAQVRAASTGPVCTHAH